MTRRPNILMVVMDCARSDRWHGPGKTAHTPVFDRLAREGASLPTTITETACTTPCFACLLSGAYSVRHGIAGVGGYTLADDMLSLAQVLRSAGYNTYAEVTGPLVEMAGLTRGFDEYNYRLAFDYMHTEWGASFIKRLSGGGFRAPWFVLLHLWELHVERQVTPDCDHEQFGENRYDRAVSSLDRQLGRILEAMPSDTLVILTGDHGEKTTDEQYRPGTAVGRARKLYEVGRSSSLGVRGAAMMIGPVAMQQLRAHFQPRLESFSQAQTPRNLHSGRLQAWVDFLRLARLAPWLRPWDFGALRSSARRLRMLEQRGVLDTDRNRRAVGRLVRRVGEEKLFDLYLRMWASQFRKQLDEGHVLHVYDFLTRVPLILHGTSGLTRGFQSERMVRQIDIAPSVLDLLEIERPEGFSPDGRSFAPLLHGKAWEAARAFQSVSAQPRDLTLRGIRTERERFTYGPIDENVPSELYDLTTDPAEQSNIASEHAARCDELRGAAESFVPSGGPRVCRAENLSTEQQRQIELRLRELGYVE